MNYTDIECSHYRKIAIRLALVCLCVETSFIIFLLYCEQLLCPFGELAFFLDHESVSAHRRVTLRKLSASGLDFYHKPVKTRSPKAHGKQPARQVLLDHYSGSEAPCR